MALAGYGGTGFGGEHRGFQGGPDEARARLDGLARLLDSAFRIPGTGIRFGLDALLNLIPGLGLLASKAVSAYLIWEARRLGVSRWTQVRMAGNVGLDAVLSAIPLVGWVSDVFFRANTRNMAILRAHLDRTTPPPFPGPGGGMTIEGEAVRVA
ncbi:MAG TPA: DUF4112 domain-containing protein [Azospirillaceae bacterium]|nr:DUF4112 domain-containing protein [Azospirillaceae bacterium]